MNITIIATFAFTVFGFRKFELSFYIPVIIGGMVLTWVFISLGGTSLGKYRWAQMQKQSVRVEADEIEKMSDWKARVLGISKEDAI